MSNMKWPTKKLGEVLDYEQPTKYIVRSTNYKKGHQTPVLTAGKSFILGYTDEKDGIFPKDKLPVIIFDDFTTASKLVDFPFKVKSSAMKILHPRRDLVDAKYVFYKMQTIDFPTTQHKRYWISKYSQIEIPLPPLSEQKRIVAKIEKLFAKIDEAERLRKESLAASAALLPSALHQVFSRAKKEKWTTKKLGEVLKLIESGSRPKGGVRHIFEGFPSIGAEHLTNNGDFNFERMKYIPRNFFKKLNRGIIQCGDILIVKDGATTGKVSLVTKNFPFEEAAVNEHVFILRSNSEIISEFLFYFLFSEKGKKQILQTFHGMTQGGINSDFVNFVEIPLPPLSEQKRIVAYLDSLSEKARALQKLQQEAASDFSTLRQSILAQVFN